MLLLYKSYYLNLVTFAVAPPVGAWIEIIRACESCAKIWVAPPVGAWIEIPVFAYFFVFSSVAPPVGAWIEIDKTSLKNVKGKGRSPRGSVDWNLHKIKILAWVQVAPPVGAWIEIRFNYVGTGIDVSSLPPWERGLKKFLRSPIQKSSQSLPPWERGLK